MAGFDFSNVSDSELEAVMDDLLNDPMARFATPVAQRQAVVAEYNRRRAKPAAKPATNVERDLDAAATPITPDPAVKPRAGVPAGPIPEDFSRRLPGESLAAYGERYAKQLEAKRRESNAAVDARMRAGYKDDARREIDAEYDSPDLPATFTRNNDGSAYSPMTDFGGGASATVDGVKVRTFDLGDGQQRYRLGDVKRAQEAEHEAKLAAMFSQSAQEDLAKYGTRQLMRQSSEIDARTGFPKVEPVPSTGLAPGDELTPDEEEQQDDLIARREAEKRTRGSWAYERARAIRMAEAAGITPSEALQMLREDGGQAALAMAGADRAARLRADARATARRNAQMAGGSQNLNSAVRSRVGTLDELGNPALSDWQRLVLAETMLRNGQNMTPLGVQALGGQNALNMLRGMNLGQGMDNPLVRAQAAAAQVQTDQARQALRQEDENVLGEKYAPGDNNILPRWLGGGYDEFTVAEQQQMYEDLIARGYTPPEAQAAVDRQAGKRRASERADWNK